MMGEQKISQLAGLPLPLRGDNIDTDQIVPARYLKEITFAKMGEYLFHDVRYSAAGQLKDHPVNNPIYKQASIMLVEKNFGCGSSREHAPQAIKRYGFKAIIGVSFAEIFAGNCKALGVMVASVTDEVAQALLAQAEKNPQGQLHIDLEKMIILCSDGTGFVFTMPEERRQEFLLGTWDAIGVLKANEQLIQKKATEIPCFYR